MTNENQARLKIITAMFLYGTIGIFVRNIPLPSSVTALVRGIIGAAFILIFMRMRKIRLSFADIKANLLLLCLSGAAIGVNWIFLFEAYRYTTVALATLCYYFSPIFIIIVSPLFLKERLTLKKFCCVLIALLGMALISGVFETAGVSALHAKGITLGIGAAALYAFVVILNKKLHHISAYDRTVVQLGVAAAILLPYTLLTEKVRELSVSIPGICLLLIVGILHTGVAYTLYFSSLRDLKAQTAAILSYIDPIVAIILSTVLLKEQMTPLSALGAVLILGATFVGELHINIRDRNIMQN